tara:strand:- start:151 stop:549 length:399 start_codon:yes stop_codon:yes gene_type:complete
MKLADIELPSNKKFGLFFAIVFFLLATFFYTKNNTTLVVTFASLCFIFVLISYSMPQLLLPLNKIWMRFGFLLGIIISPIVLGIIFFCIFTPVGLVMKIFQRDELRIKLKNRESFWKDREYNSVTTVFKNQF